MNTTLKMHQIRKNEHFFNVVAKFQSLAKQRRYCTRIFENVLCNHIELFIGQHCN